MLSHYPFHRHDHEIQDERNKECADIRYSPRVKKLFEIGDSDEPSEKMTFDMLSFEQLKEHCRQQRAKGQNEKLDTLNILRKNKNLIQQQTLDKRFLELVTGADIPRLGTLLQVCHNKGMGLQSIIGRIGDALSIKYKMSKYGEDQWDIGVIALRIGGPKLLHILHKTHGLPAPRSVQNHIGKSSHFAAAVDMSFKDRINNNSKTTTTYQQCNKITTIKMDEIATESRLRWCSKENKILGLCYQHSHDTDLSFNTIKDVYVIRDEIEAGHIHKTKETLVVASGVIGNGGSIQSLLTLPSCSKTESQQFLSMIEAISEEVDPDVIATDGDSMRRRVLNGKDKLIQDKDVKSVLGKLPLFDLHIVDGKRALYFDDKHNGKRLRGTVISDTRGCLIGTNVLSFSQLKYIFDLAGITNYKDVLCPRDRQNVPAVLKLVEKLNECIAKLQNSDDQVCRELIHSIQILSKIFDGILCMFSSPAINLCDQLEKLSTLSHILYHYKQYGTKFIPGQLYHDLQRMVQASYYACVLLKARGGGKMYLYQMGTDQEEKVFGSIRTITHARNCDVLELCSRLQHAETINEIIAKHPTWKRFHGKRLGSYNDASSQADWTGELNVDDIDFYQRWILGRSEACAVLNIEPSYFAVAPGYSMLKPNKRLVGVTVDVEREEVEEVTTESVSSDDVSSTDITDNIEIEESLQAPSELEENEISLEIEEMIENNSTPFKSIVDVEGKEKHKASVIRELFNESGSSADRLRRVRVFSKFISDENELTLPDDLELDEMIMLGDKVCGKITQDGSACLAIGKISSMRDLTDKKYQTVSPVGNIVNLQLQVNICHAKVNDGMLVVGDATSRLITWKGTHCCSLNLSNMSLEIEKALSIMTSLPLADNQPTLLACLPYHPSLAVCLQPGEATNKISCQICGEAVEKKAMRKHVGIHIIKDGLGIVCGYCGLASCSIDLVRGSGRGKTMTMIPGSNCTYQVKFSLKSAEMSTKSSPCTNRPITCEHCKTVQWSYNLPKHCKEKHSDYPIPTTITDEERKLLGVE